jgi:predicted RNA-binding protein Jag
LNPNFILGTSKPIIPSTTLQQATRTINQVVKETTRPGPTVEAAKNAVKYEDHHIIPRALKENKIVDKAIKEGFKFDGKENKIPVEKFSRQTGEGQHGNHPKYTEHIKDKISDFVKKIQNLQDSRSWKVLEV